MRISALALCLLSSAWPAVPPAAAPVTLVPFHDTWVSSATPVSSYGVSPYLSAESTTGGFERFYMEFNTSSIAGQTISSAILRLWVVRENTGDATDAFELYPINSAWNDGLTYNDSLLLTQGTLVTSVPATDYGINNTVSPAQLVTFDITPLVQVWASGGVNKGLMIQLSAGSKADIRFASLEDSTGGLSPSLEVTTGAAPPPPPPPPPDPDPDPTPTPTPSGRRGEDSDGKCGCGTVSTSGIVNGMALAGLLGLLLLAVIGRRPDVPKQ